MTTWSLTPFFNEVDVLEIRLATLDPVVDIHVIAESTLTYSGDPKRLHFHEHMGRFLPWADKIRYVIVDDSPQGKDGKKGMDFIAHKGLNWERENHQRDALSRGWAGMGDDDLVLLSDVDEIPSPETVQSADRAVDFGDVQRVYLPQHVMKLNWRWDEMTTKAICRFTSGKDMKKHGPEKIRNIEKGPVWHDTAGWHFSYMGGPEMVKYKIQHAAHSELDRPQWTDLEQIAARMEKGRDMFDRRDRQAHWVSCDTLPAYVQENTERFSHLLIDRPEGS